MAKRRRDPTMASEVIRRISGRLGAGFDPGLLKLQNGWMRMVGDHIAAHSEPVKFVRKMLIVRVDHPAWMNELSFLKAQMIEKINEGVAGRKIDDIRFELGKVTQAAKREDAGLPAPQRPLSDDEEEFIRQAAGEIDDESVREAALSAMRRSFGSKRKS